MKFRYVVIKGEKYLHQDDVTAYLHTLAGSEETDTRNRLRQAADNIAIAGVPGPLTPSSIT